MPQVAISADFLTAFSQVPRAQQKKVREFITRFQLDPTMHSINYESIHDTLDVRVRTVRIGLDYRAIVLHPDTGDVYLLAWVDHHDEAMDWAKRKRFEVNPITGSFQIFDPQIIEQVQAEAGEGEGEGETAVKPLSEYTLFETFADDELCRTGLPSLLLPAIRSLKTAVDLDKLEPYLPGEAFEALYWIANFGYSVDQAIAEAGTKIAEKPVDVTDIDASLNTPNSMRRIAIVNTPSALAEILNQPLAKWRIFLHPSQYNLVHRNFNGPARVLGGAGTGKTVVAMHRARHLAATVFNKPTDRILFTTYTRNLAQNIQDNLRHLCGSEMERIEVVNLHRWAVGFLRSQGFKIKIAEDDEIDACWDEAILAVATGDWDGDFYTKEWYGVIKAQNITTKAEYFRARRHGQGVPLNRPQRAAVWDVFAEFKRKLDDLGKMEWADVITQARLYLEQKGNILPYKAVIVDETQDLTLEELRLLRQIVPEGENDLFLVGDAHQRIYGRPVVMSHCGINIRGRSRKLRINYRTTDEIRKWSVAVLEGVPVDDLDGGQDSLKGYISLRNGISPIVKQFGTFEEEVTFLVNTITDKVTSDVSAESICLVARTHRFLDRYTASFDAAGLEYVYLDKDTPEDSGAGIRMATMHRVKGLEFPHMYLAAVNDGVIPFVYAGGESLDEEEILQERCLLHVAASRARDTLTITSYGQASPFLGEM